MSDSDIVRATEIALPFVAGIRACESGGNPAVVRFEPHLFERFHPDAVRRLDPTPGGWPQPDDERRAAWAAGCVPYTRGKTRAASDSRLETGREALEHAMAIDGVAAIRSTSFGAFQVLGGHLLHLCPGKTPALALAAFDSAPAEWSDRLLVEWLHANPRALAAAKAGRIDEFITAFNGAHDTSRYRKRFDPAFLAAGGKL